MENHALVWKVIGAVAVITIIASFSFIFSTVRDIQAIKSPDSSVLDELLQAVRKTDSSYAAEPEH